MRGHSSEEITPRSHCTFVGRMTSILSQSPWTTQTGASSRWLFQLPPSLQPSRYGVRAFPCM